MRGGGGHYSGERSAAQRLVHLHMAPPGQRAVGRSDLTGLWALTETLNLSQDFQAYFCNECVQTSSQATSTG